MTLRHITNFSSSQLQNWYESAGVVIPNIIGLDYGVEGTATAIEMLNNDDGPSTLTNTTIDFQILFDSGYTISDILRIVVWGNGVVIGRNIEINNTINVLDFTDNIGGKTSIAISIDTTNGNHIKYVTDSNGMCTIYWDNISLLKVGIAAFVGMTKRLGVYLPTDKCKILGCKWYDQAIYPPDELPNVDVSNGTLYCTDQEVRNAGRFRLKMQLVPETNATTYVHKDRIESIVNDSLIKVNRSTGAVTQLVRVKSSPATGQYVFTGPSVFVFGDAVQSTDEFWAEIEHGIHSNEIADCRAEAQAEVDSILAAKFSAVPLTPSTIYTQVRKSVAELTALIILRRMTISNGKDTRNIDSRYKQILTYLTNLAIFTLNGTTYTPTNPNTPDVDPWQNGDAERDRTRELLWQQG
jgi:hypothetical protein